ncbi:MAG: glycosyl hydrolase family 8 [Ruminococcus flavefaciens]|nr:glycosyl hydrolase family 8 [Ruminococcus flavefaciens]MCM1230311.1 glycosyl hydrolase family 8 [Ruminococcus flavefaciens]
MKFRKNMLTVILTAFVAQGILPSCSASAVGNQLSGDTADFYNYWKDKYVVQDNYTTDEARYYVWYSDTPYSDNNTGIEVTVSEAHGYGMLITASMAEYDDNAKEIFDGMYAYYKAHLSEIAPNLMAWQQIDNGSAIVNTSGADSATDGDMDIAYSLLMADSIWGSDGDIDYRQSAVDIINDIMEYEVNKTDWILQLGDWAYWSEEGDTEYSATRASDFIMQYMPVFAEATGDERWLNVYDSTYSIINSIVDEYKTGILPDFIVKDSATGRFIPSPANFLESDYDGCYYYNSCRTPWRISMDYLINGNENAKKFADTITDFIFTATDSDPYEIKAGYKLDGTPVEDYDDLCFTAPFMISASCGDNTEWHNAVRDTAVNYGEDVYFGDTIKMLCLIVDDGGWLVPDSGTVTGDVNSDGRFDIADLVAVQNFLIDNGRLADWKAGDLCKDERIDMFDFCLMRQLITESG